MPSTQSMLFKNYSVTAQATTIRATLALSVVKIANPAAIVWFLVITIMLTAR